MKFNIKIFHYILSTFCTFLIVFLYLIQNSLLISLGIFPWLAIESIWFFVLKFDTYIDKKTINLLFSFLFLFTALLPLLELLFFGSNFFFINKQIVTLMENEVAFFVLYILLIIFFFLYFLLSLIFYFNLIKDSITIEKSTDNNISYANKFVQNFVGNITENRKKGNIVKSLNLPEIDIKPFIPEDHNDIVKSIDEESRIEEETQYKNNENKYDESNDILNLELANEIYENEEDKNKYVEDVEEIECKNSEFSDEKYEEINNISKKEPKNIDNSELIYEKSDKFSIDQFIPESIHPHFVSNEDDIKVIEEKGRIILKTLRDFGIESKLLNYIKGPVVTRFELEIDEKINLGKLINLEKNITYNLSAEKIRILAPIPGKKAVGIEIPNEIKQIVYFTDLAKTEEFKNSNMHLPFILGKDIEGKIQVTDISKSPHLLIAGRTGSGKSVCINTLIASLVIANPPEKVRLLLIDPKRVELSLYNDLPHLLTDEIIIFPEDASAALKWLVAEMENRYAILKDNGFRSIEDFNQSMDERLPYLVLIIDEFYALMQTSQKIIEDSLIHLSAMARAVGIHLIFATQRPSAEVVTGVIKSNLPSRIAFQTFSKTDSRIILDTNGAESLLGNGDMLFSFAGLPPVRIQGAFISTNEVRELVKKISQTYKTERKAINELFADVKKEENGYNDEFLTDDPLYPQAVEIIKKERKVSASYLQRRLKIGYNRAARIVEQMEEEGIISPLIDGKKREIYI